MSTAAPPAAASAAAVPAAPSQPAGEPTAPQAAQPSQIKPIPPSRTPRLPGVMEDGPEDASAPEAQAARARDAAGRFAKAPDGEPIVGKPQPKAVEVEEPAIPEPPGEPKPFMFAGKPFKTQAEAEHWAKSMEGRYKPVQEKATQTEGQLVKAAESARGWHAEAQRLQAEIAELRAGKQAEPAAPAPGIDWALYADIVKAANEAGQPEKAHEWLMGQHDALRAADAKTLRDEIARLREEAIENPRREAEHWAEMEQTAKSLADSLAAQTNPDGTPAFPEFRDGDTARAVGELWRMMGNDPEAALTPQGAVNAVALYRLAQSMGTVPTTPAPSPLPPDPAAEAAAGLDGGRPLMPAATNRRELDPQTARLLAGLKNTTLIRPGLGFEQ